MLPLSINVSDSRKAPKPPYRISNTFFFVNQHSLPYVGARRGHAKCLCRSDYPRRLAFQSRLWLREAIALPYRQQREAPCHTRTVGTYGIAFYPNGVWLACWGGSETLGYNTTHEGHKATLATGTAFLGFRHPRDCSFSG